MVATDRVAVWKVVTTDRVAVWKVVATDRVAVWKVVTTDRTVATILSGRSLTRKYRLFRALDDSL